MKISRIEVGKANISAGAAEERILPADRPKGLVTSKKGNKRQLSPLEKGMAVAEEAIANVPDIRAEMVNELKEKIKKGEYNVSGSDIAEMMMRRLAADKIR